MGDRSPRRHMEHQILVTLSPILGTSKDLWRQGVDIQDYRLGQQKIITTELKMSLDAQPAPRLDRDGNRVGKVGTVQIYGAPHFGRYFAGRSVPRSAAGREPAWLLLIFT